MVKPENESILNYDLVDQLQTQLEEFAENNFKKGRSDSVFTMIRTMTLQFCDVYEAHNGLSIDAMLRFYSWLCLTCSPDELAVDKERLIQEWVNGFLETFFCWNPESTLKAINSFIDNLDKDGILTRLKKK